MPRQLGIGDSIVVAWFTFVSLGIYTSLSVWFIDRDMRKLPPDKLERAYSPVSFAAAIFGMMQIGLPQIAVLVHFIRTRRSVAGVLLGLFWALLTFVPVIALAAVVQLLVPDLG
jgi:hypothetical protein